MENQETNPQNLSQQTNTQQEASSSHQSHISDSHPSLNEPIAKPPQQKPSFFQRLLGGVSPDTHSQSAFTQSNVENPVSPVTLSITTPEKFTQESITQTPFVPDEGKPQIPTITDDRTELEKKQPDPSQAIMSTGVPGGGRNRTQY